MTSRPFRPDELSLFGYRLHPMTGEEVIARIADAVDHRERLIVANLNLHGMAMVYDSPTMADLLAQKDCITLIDGMPILLLANLLRRARLPRDKRTTSLDFYDAMFALGAKRGWQFAYVGAQPDILARGLDVLKSRFPGLRIEGRDGYFPFPDDTPGAPARAVVDWLRALSPDVVIVGMGMPRQEEWIAHVQNQVDVRVFLPTGAYIDYQTGAQKPAPRWLGRYGLEGIYRLIHSPYRLGHRYLVEPFVLAYRIASGRPRPRRGSTPEHH